MFFKTAISVDCHIGFFWAAVPVIIEMWHSSSPANQISSIYNIACFNLQEQRYHSQSVRVILPVHNCFRCYIPNATLLVARDKMQRFSLPDAKRNSY